jgi:3-hydroxy-5-phosphonooxypentane-2,4-dione thiolase
MSWGRNNRLSRIFDPASGRTNMLAVDHGYFLGPIITTVEDALRLNAAAVALSVFVGTEHERQTLGALARLVDEAGRYDLPVLAVTAVGKELGTYDARYLGLATRICAELGADMVKTYHTDGFEAVVEAAMVPVVVAGGKRLDAARDAFALASDAVTAGAAGIDFGRNVWQSAHPIATIQALRAVVHDGQGVDDAVGLYERLAGQRVPAGR